MHVVDKNEVLFNPTGKLQEGDLYKAEDGQVYELKRRIVTTADGNAYRCFQLEPAKGLGHASLPLRPPRIVVDSHMHIQSSNTSTLPFLRSNMGDAPVGRRFISGMATVAGGLHDVLTSRPQRDVLNRELGRKNKDGGYSRGLGFSEISEESSGTTYEVGKRFLAKIDRLVQDFREVKPYRQAEDVLGIGIIMTMDMEYAHLFGYYGIKIYNPVYLSEADLRREAEPEGIWYPWRKEGAFFRPGNGSRASNYSAEGETRSDFEDFARSRERDGLAGTVYGPGSERSQVFLNCKIREAPRNEVKNYETWKKQLRHTKQAVIGGELRLLPMYHYDPRRWQGGDDEAFKHVGKNGIFLGFKMYTAQGYRPWDPRLPNLAAFYAKCAKNGIPILNHCTSEGAPTYDREAYINHRHPRDTEKDEEQKLISAVRWHPDTEGYPRDSIAIRHEGDHDPSDWKKAYRIYGKNYLVDVVKGKEAVPPERKAEILAHLRQCALTQVRRDGAEVDTASGDTGTGYFNDHFVSPHAWRIVLDKHRDLRLCLAHFGGNKEVERTWAHEIARMMGEQEGGKPKYPNFYSDISSSFGNAEFRTFFKELLKTYPHIRERTLFGTDWYLALLGLRGMDLLNYTKTSKEFFDGIDKTLWPQITEENPCRFYRLGERIQEIAESLIKEKKAEMNQEETRAIGRNHDDQKPGKDLSTYSIDIRKRAERIKARAFAMTEPGPPWYA